MLSSLGTLGRCRLALLALAAAVLAGCGSGQGTVASSAPLPTITTQPAGVTVDDGQNASFSVVATGVAPLSYQWQRYGENIVGATSATFTLSPATYNDDGVSITVIVTDVNGSTVSNTAVVHINPVAPTIVTQPTAQTANTDGSASFTVVARGTAPLQFQWFKDDVAIPEATNSGYRYSGVQLADNGALFKVSVTNSVGSVTSAAVALTVNATSPTIVTQPQAQSVLVGDSATFTVVATGTGPLTFQWRRNTAPISGATSAAYVLSNAALFDTGALFDVVVTNGVGSVTSATASLTVTPSPPIAPSIVTQPANTSAAPGGSASFNVVAAGTAPLSYQWSRNGVAIVGATNATYTLSPVASLNNNDSYVVTVSNAGGSLPSSAAVLTVTAPPSGIDLVAGQLGGPGNLDGIGAGARFEGPSGVAVDAAGNVFVADFSGSAIRKINTDGSVVHVAGGSPGFADGVAANAQFRYPSGLALDAAGTLYVADTSNFLIRKITSAGVVSTVAGTVGVAGAANGTGTAASFSFPRAVAVDTAGNLYIADPGNYLIRKITPAGVVSTLAGSAGVPGFANATGTAAQFAGPFGIVVDAAGMVYVADTYNNTIRRITPAGVVTTIAGNPAVTGFSDGTGVGAAFNRPQGLVLDANGDLLVGDTGNNRVRRVTVSGVVTTVAGNGFAGDLDGTGPTARFAALWGLSVDAGNNVYVADFNNDSVRKISITADVTTLAGSAPATGTIDGVGAGARFNAPWGVAVDADGNAVVADSGNSTIRRVTAAGTVSTLAGLAGSTGSTDGTASAARFNAPAAVAVDSAGTVYIADTGNSTIRRITAAGTVSTFAGVAGTTGSSNGSGSAALFNAPRGIAVDAAGTVYVADTGNSTIRRITAAGMVTTLAGSAGVPGSANGSGGAARFTAPEALTVDAAGNVYVADTGNFTIRRVTAAGAVTTVAGSPGLAGHTDGVAATARFDAPSGIALDGNGNLYVTDKTFCILRKITPAAEVTTVAGLAGQHGVTLGPLPGSFNNPAGLALAPGAALRLFMTDRTENVLLSVQLP